MIVNKKVEEKKKRINTKNKNKTQNKSNKSFPMPLPPFIANYYFLPMALGGNSLKYYKHTHI